MKALVLAGGRGRRLEGHTAECNKSMLEFAGRPLIEHSLDNAVRLAPEEIVIVVGYLAEQVINHFGTSYRGVRIRYAIQREQRGLVHAIETAAPFIGTSDFMLFLADEILLEPNHAAMLERYNRDDVFALCGVTFPSDREAVTNTYAVLEDQQGRILRLIEKPRRALNDCQGTGNILFHNRILEYLQRTPINQGRNERELPDLIQCAIDEGHIVRSFTIGGRYININTPEHLTEAERDFGPVSAVGGVRA
jgi:UDP-N-acetylglucosamine diphosphorylase / glucose-1-phosphate thymidylyltransferase / UDP-N-acetylgalactosamine diphosphorylase / glucosamine-1-phosphate N-acetyltransferase / galactosamine-1-phosphate N-acetyltransferase